MASTLQSQPSPCVYICPQAPHSPPKSSSLSLPAQFQVPVPIEGERSHGNSHRLLAAVQTERLLQRLILLFGRRKRETHDQSMLRTAERAFRINGPIFCLNADFTAQFLPVHIHWAFNTLVSQLIMQQVLVTYQVCFWDCACSTTPLSKFLSSEVRAFA